MVNSKDILTIQCKLDGFSINEGVKTNEYEKVVVIFDNNNSTLVPKAFFQASEKEKYLSFLDIINDVILHNELPSLNAVNIFSISQKDYDYCLNFNKNVDIQHFSTLFIEESYRKNGNDTKPKIFINIRDNRFEMVAFDNNKLLMHNIYSFKTREDFAYYLLYAMQQYKLDGETTQLFLSGSIVIDSPLVDLLSRYIRTIQITKSNLDDINNI